MENWTKIVGNRKKWKKFVEKAKLSSKKKKKKKKKEEEKEKEEKEKKKSLGILPSPACILCNQQENMDILQNALL
ncbi:hypothetical protein ANN_27466 [Periplaneta americana]|uniref:Uncharacterized protein n=1 Tax=Periplaneta americana TaxID=6978 RepID=A0ABQ8RW22_PERAM|nr:hypothetical protein ANN_27466 [Periplaneta americana]